MIKTCNYDSGYMPGRRSPYWVKFKTSSFYDGDYSVENTYDLVIVGADYDTGKRNPYFKSFLLACYDDQF